jgi:hypothetical protein
VFPDHLDLRIKVPYFLLPTPATSGDDSQVGQGDERESRGTIMTTPNDKTAAQKKADLEIGKTLNTWSVPNATATPW